MKQYAIKSLHTGWFHMNWGHIMSPVGKLDLMADMVIPGHDAEVRTMRVIPDDYTIE